MCKVGCDYFILALDEGGHLIVLLYLDLFEHV